MSLFRSFFPFVFCAVIFAPISGFAAIEDAKTTDDAKNQYKTEVSSLVRKYQSRDVRQSVLDDVQNVMAANSDKVGLEQAYDAAKANEQSIANKVLGGAATAATGIGGMQFMQGMAEKKADDAASAEMSAYLSTIKCGVGGAKNLSYNEPGRTPEDPAQLSSSRTEYIAIARKMKSAKEALGMEPGIESELIIDTSNLYDNSGTDTDGIVNHFDTATERADSGDAQKRMKTGGLIAGAGAAGGIAGNEIIKSGKSGEIMSGIGNVVGSLGSIATVASGVGGILGAVK